MAGTKTFQETIATTEHDRHEADDELVKQPCVDGLLDDACPMSCTFLPSATARASSIAASTPSVTNVYDGSPVGTTSGSRRVRMNRAVRASRLALCKRERRPLPTRWLRHP